MALTTGKQIPSVKSAAPSRPFPDTPAPHATAAKAYIAVVTVPAADDATNPVARIQYLEPPTADATVDKTYVLSLSVLGADTTGGSTAIPTWVEYTADLTP